ncbi:MAG: hypothetical protein CXR30_15335 [Geobacter sp.]|nr:MAG: hypothetical protein CXR30_15335 [Geobacter sp.]
MVNILGIRLGRYIQYEQNCPIPTSDQIIYPNIKIVTDADQLKEGFLGIQRERLETLLHNGAELFVYIENDLPLGMLWGYRGSCYIRGPGIPLLLDDDTVYSFWAYVVPEARGKKIYRKIRDVFFSYYKGVKKYVSLVEPSNTIARIEKKKDAYTETKKITYIKFRCISIIIEQFTDSQRFNIHLESGNQYDLLMI